MVDTPRDRSTPVRRATAEAPPKHPTRQAVLLLVGVTLLIVALAALSSSGGV